MVREEAGLRHSKLTAPQAHAVQPFWMTSHLLMVTNFPILPAINGVELRMKPTNCD